MAEENEKDEVSMSKVVPADRQQSGVRPLKQYRICGLRLNPDDNPNRHFGPWQEITEPDLPTKRLREIIIAPGWKKVWIELDDGSKLYPEDLPTPDP